MEGESVKYLNHISEILKKVQDTQWESIDKLAKLMAENIRDKKNIFIFGASHASILAQEMFYRTGGLSVINPILPKELMLDIRPVTETSKMERVEGYATVILDGIRIKEGDLLILHSVSGRNNSAVEMARVAKDRNIKTACITNLNYSKQVKSRDKSGKKLFEVCDIVIDNCGDFEDSSMLLPNMTQKIAPTSSVIGCAIVNMLEIRCVEHLLTMGVTPPVFHSANVDGGDEFNKTLLEKYKDQIFYM